MRLLFCALVVVVNAGCGDDDGVASCVPGATESCACLGGRFGVQECQDDGTFGECRCTPNDDSGPGPGMDAGPMPGVDAGPRPDLDGGPMPGVDAGPPADVSGHVVLMGAPIWQVDEAFNRIFANAILLTERSGVIDVVEYTQYFPVGSGWEMNARNAMDAEATARGRTIVRTELTSSTGLDAALASADVFFVPMQSTDEGTMRTIAGFWHDTLVRFVDAGGVIVVVSGSDGRAGRFIVDAPEFFMLSALPPPGFSTGEPTQFEITDAAHPLASGVLSPWASNAGQYTCFPGSTGGRTVARSRDTALCPIVRHLVR